MHHYNIDSWLRPWLYHAVKFELCKSKPSDDLLRLFRFHSDRIIPWSCRCETGRQSGKPPISGETQPLGFSGLNRLIASSHLRVEAAVEAHDPAMNHQCNTHNCSCNVKYICKTTQSTQILKLFKQLMQKQNTKCSWCQIMLSWNYEYQYLYRLLGNTIEKRATFACGFVPLPFSLFSVCPSTTNATTLHQDCSLEVGWSAWSVSTCCEDSM